MTNPIPGGTRNSGWNGPIAFMILLGQWVYRHGFSLGQFIRSAVVHEVERTDPETARRLRAELKAYYGAIMLGLFLGLLGSSGDHEPRRVSRPRPAIRREVRA